MLLENENEDAKTNYAAGGTFMPWHMGGNCIGSPLGKAVAVGRPCHAAAPAGAVLAPLATTTCIRPQPHPGLALANIPAFALLPIAFCAAALECLSPLLEPLTCVEYKCSCLFLLLLSLL